MLGDPLPANLREVELAEAVTRTLARRKADTSAGESGVDGLVDQIDGTLPLRERERVGRRRTRPHIG